VETGLTAERPLPGDDRARVCAEEGIPQDLIYLAQAESAFSSRWRFSRAPAHAGHSGNFVAWRGHEIRG